MVARTFQGYSVRIINLLKHTSSLITFAKKTEKEKKKGGAGAVAMKEASKVSTAEAPNFVFSPSFRQLDL